MSFRDVACERGPAGTGRVLGRIGPVRRVWGVALLLSLLSLGLASPAYARRTVPTGFFGVVVPPLMVGQPTAALNNEMALMASSGVETIRVGFSWSQLEPEPGVYVFGALDQMVKAAVEHGLHVTVNVAYTAAWDSTDASVAAAPPKSAQPFAALMRALVTRYGPHGTLFAENPGLPHTPVHEWQIWNEEDAPWYWKDPHWWRGYTTLLKAAYPVIHQLDRQAVVVAGSLVASSYKESPWVALSQLYSAGAKRYFDAVSVHPFTDTASSLSLSMNHLLTIVQRMRSVMRKAHDGKKPLLITEMQWSAAAGKVPKAALLGFETTPAGQAKRLAAAYTVLAKQRRALGLTQVYWSSWATEYNAQGDLSDMIFRFTGLTRYAGGVFTPLPLLGTYVKTAARLEGCRKGSTGRCR